MQTKTQHILLKVLLLLLSFSTVFAQKKDSIYNVNVDNNIVNDSLTIRNDSITKPQSSAIDAIIDHTADDYILEDMSNKTVTLYDNARIIYGEYDINAGKIVIDYKTNIVTAIGIKDSIGKYSQLPKFKTSNDETTQDSIIFNYKTKKALIYGLVTQQDGINTLGQKTKRVNDSTIFARNIIFTTSDPKNPDYYLKTKKAKIVPGKKIITGSTNLVLADVPTPLFFPFAYFPLTKERTSGLIFPTYGESNNQGFFLQNGGYYFAISDYIDLKVTGDIYSNSSWGIRVGSNYRVRYKFNGSFNFNYDNLISGIEGFSNFSEAKNFNLRWSHSQDTKSSPNGRFAANVNLGSSQYYRQSVNSSVSPLSQTNVLSSSISYYKKFVGTPFNMNVTASHRQNTNTKTVNMTLPALQLNMERQYPFAPKSGIKKNAIQNIGVNYSLRAENRIDTTEDEFFTPEMFESARNGVQHNMSLGTNMKVLKYFSLAPSVSYREIWNFKRFKRQYDEESNTILTDTLSGFQSFRNYSGGASLSTTVYGMFKFKNSKLKAIRHTMRPSISYNYTPDFSSNLDQVQSNVTGDEFRAFNKSDGGLYTASAGRVSSSMGISLANSFEAKVRDDDSPTGEDKKIKLLNSLNINTSYNFAADSLKLSPLSVTTGTLLFKKLNVNFGTSLDPYALNSNNQRINKLNIDNGGSLFRMTRANFTASFSLSSKDFDKSKKDEKEDEDVTQHDQNLFGEDLRNNNDTYNRIDRTENQEENQENKDMRFYRATVPWNLRVSYSTNYSNNRRQDQITSRSLQFSGDIELSPGWKIGASSGYDFINKGFTYTQLRFNRDLKSWNMSFNWIPLGSNTSYYFFIGVKAAVLSDLKWDKRNFNRPL